MDDKIDLQEKLRSSNWKAEDLFEDIRVQEETRKTEQNIAEKPQLGQGENISTTPEVHTKNEWKDIKQQEKIAEMGDQKDMILKSRISTYEQAKALYEEKETPLAKKQMNQALKDIKEIDPEYTP